ncbi:MAG: ParB/RepB/Spo0J family partition protein [Clostridia bacterium]|nr:ParB/RepB/Spo0J family partition protein [Clostridia bacterium]
MAKNTGLGKGLDALFTDKLVIEDEKEDKKEQKIEGELVEKIKIIDIEPNKNQPRRKFDSEAIEELAESIKIYGIIQPIIVTKKDGFYEIVAGERRWRAAKKAGLPEVPCIVRENDERKNKEIALIENIQREDLNPIEKARGFRQLIDEYGITQQALADIMGINRSTLTNCLRILNLDQRVIELALEGKLSEGHCRSLLAFDPEEQYEIALKVIETGRSIRDIEQTIKNRKVAEKKTKEEKKKYSAIYKDIEDRFQGFFGTKVKLDAGARSGKIIIKYSTNDELERLLELINK